MIANSWATNVPVIARTVDVLKYPRNVLSTASGDMILRQSNVRLIVTRKHVMLIGNCAESKKSKKKPKPPLCDMESVPSGASLTSAAHRM